MSNKKKTIHPLACIFIISLSLLVLTGCSFGQIEDTNGDLNELNQLVIEEHVDKTSHANYVVMGYHNASGGVSGEYSEYDHDNVIERAGKFSGIMEIQHTQLDSNESVTIKLSITHEVGNFIVVILDPDNSILEEVNESGDFEYTYSAQGLYRILIFGESAKFELEVNRVIF